MNKELKSVATKFVQENIGDFHQARLASLSRLKLKGILERKNPYLFKAKNILTSEQLVRAFMEARLSSQEETIFGDFLENLAIHINSHIYEGRKSSAVGIDLEFEKGGNKYIVSIKSGPNWGNSSQIKKMESDFRTAKKVLGTSKGTRNVVSVNGCCYGKDSVPEKSDYLKLCGQRFWEFISGDANLYTDIIEPLGYKAKERNGEFEEQYAALLNKLTHEFTTEFCNKGKIDWGKLVRFNSEK